MKLFRFKRFENIEIGHDSVLDEKLENIKSFLPLHIELSESDEEVDTHEGFLISGSNYVFIELEDEVITRDELLNLMVQADIESLYIYEKYQLRKLELLEDTYTNITIYIPFELTVDEVCDYYDVKNDMEDYFLSNEEAFKSTTYNLNNIFEDDYDDDYYYDSSYYLSIEQLLDSSDELKDYIEKNFTPNEISKEFNIEHYDESEMEDIRIEISSIATGNVISKYEEYILEKIYNNLNELENYDVKYKTEDNDVIIGFIINVISIDSDISEYYHLVDYFDEELGNHYKLRERDFEFDFDYHINYYSAINTFLKYENEK